MDEKEKNVIQSNWIRWNQIRSNGWQGNKWNEFYHLKSNQTDEKEKLNRIRINSFKWDQMHEKETKTGWAMKWIWSFQIKSNWWEGMNAIDSD